MINKTSLFKDWTNFRFGKRILNFQKKFSSITKKSAPHIFTRYLLMYIVALFKSSEVTNTLYSLVEPSPGINTKFVLIDQDGSARYNQSVFLRYREFKIFYQKIERINTNLLCSNFMIHLVSIYL